MTKEIRFVGKSPFLIFLFFFALLTSSVNRVNAQNLFTPYNSSLSTNQARIVSQIQRKESTIDLRIIKVNTESFLNDDAVNLNLFPVKNFVANRERMEIRNANDFDWYGSVPGKQSDIILSVYEDAVVGFITIEDEPYNLWSLGNGLHVLVHQDPSKYPGCGNSYNTKETLFNKSFPKKNIQENINENPTPLKSSPNSTSASTQTNTIIKVFVAYTTAAKNDAGGTSGMIALINNARASANVSYNNSDVSIQLDIAYTMEVINYTEVGTESTYYPECPASLLRYDDLKRFKEPSDGYMDEIHDFRGFYGGDVAVLIVADDAIGACGEAYEVGAFSSAEAFSIVKQDCANLNAKWSFAHEIGHLHGARHHDDLNCTYPYAYGHGYVFPPSNKTWQTMMGISNAVPRVKYWSNPDITYQGNDTGEANCCDNARALDQSASTVADFVREESGTPSTATYSGIVLITGDITFTSSQTVSANAQIFVKNNVEITVSNGAILTISSGAKLKFGSGAKLTINGTLNVNGTSPSQVTFTRSGATGSWDGVTFNANSSGNINYAVIDYVSNSDGVNIQSASPTIQNTTIRNCLWGLNLNTSNAVIQNCTLDNNDEGVFDRYGAAQYLAQHHQEQLWRSHRWRRAQF